MCLEQIADNAAEETIGEMINPSLRDLFLNRFVGYDLSGEETVLSTRARVCCGTE